MHNELGVLTPYTPSISQALFDHLETAGFILANTVSFAESNEHRVAHISEQSVMNGIGRLVEKNTCDAIFISCTNVKTAHYLPAAEKHFNKAIISSNAALAWHMQTLSRQD